MLDHAFLAFFTTSLQGHFDFDSHAWFQCAPSCLAPPPARHSRLAFRARRLAQLASRPLLPGSPALAFPCRGTIYRALSVTPGFRVLCVPNDFTVRADNSQAR